MSNKAFLKPIVDNLDKEYPKSAMVFGTDGDEINPVHVFVLLDDNFMYFGKQVPETENVKIKKIDIDKISKVSFDETALSIQIKDGLHRFVIKTDETALRSMCKEFKMLKSKEATKECENILDMDIEERQIPEPLYNHLRTDISPYGMQNKNQNISSSGEHKDVVAIMQGNPKEVDVIMNKLSQVVNSLESEVTPEIIKEPSRDFLSEMLASNPNKEVQPSLFTEVAPAEPAKEKTAQFHIDVIPEKYEELKDKAKSPQVEEVKKPLTKKEKKAIEKQKKKAEKEERKMYSGSHTFRNILVGLFLLVLTYIAVSYTLVSLNIMTLPLSDFVNIMVAMFNDFLANIGF